MIKALVNKMLYRGETSGNLIKTFFVYGFIAISLIVLKILIARFYGQEALGIFTYFFSVASFVFLFTSFGFPEAITQTIIKSPRKITSAVLTSLSLMVPLSVFFIAVSFHMPFFSGILPWKFLFISYIFTYSLFFLMYSIFRGRKKFAEGSLYSLIGRIFLLIFLLGLAYLGITFDLFLLFLSVGLILSVLVGLPRLITLWKEHKQNESVALKVFVRLAFCLFLMQVGFYSLRYVDAILIQYLVDFTSLGLYSAYASVTNVIRLIAYVFPVVVLPMAVLQTYKIKKSLRRVLLLLVPFSTVVLLLCYLVVPLLYGPEFIGGWLPVALVVASTLLVLYSYLNSIFVGENTFTSFYLTIIGLDFVLSLGLNTVLTIIMIGKWGIIGAPIGTAITIVFKILLNLYGLAYLRRNKEKMSRLPSKVGSVHYES